MKRYRCLLVLSLVCVPQFIAAAPNISNVSLRGLQIGGTTTLTIEGSDLVPNPVIVTSVPIASQTVRPNPQANRVEIDVTLGDQVAPGIFPLRLGSGKGISNAVVIGVDRLAQRAMSDEIHTLPVALHGNLSGTQIVTTRFRGTKGQKVVVDVEARRLGANFKPVVRLKDAKGRQLAWSAGSPQLLSNPHAERKLRCAIWLLG